MILDFDSIPKLCINLPKNVDRKRKVLLEFKKHKIKDVEFFTAINGWDLKVPEASPKQHESNARGILGCAMSHIELIKIAKASNYPAICVFEDDVIFCEQFRQRIKYIESLHNFDFDVFSLGGHYPSQDKWNERFAFPTDYKYIYKTIALGGTYAYIITEKVYDFILRNWWYGLGADQLFSDYVYKNFKSYAMTPFLAGVEPNVSDVTGISSIMTYENVNWFFHREQILEL